MKLFSLVWWPEPGVGGVWGGMNTFLCVAGPFCCSPATITTLLINHIPVKSFLKWGYLYLLWQDGPETETPWNSFLEDRNQSKEDLDSVNLQAKDWRSRIRLAHIKKPAFLFFLLLLSVEYSLPLKISSSLKWALILIKLLIINSGYWALSLARLGFPHNSVGKEALQCRRLQFDSLVGKICWRRDRLPTPIFLGFPCGSAGKESACNVGDLGFIPGLGRSPGEGRGCTLQYSGLENSMN